MKGTVRRRTLRHGVSAYVVLLAGMWVSVGPLGLYPPYVPTVAFFAYLIGNLVGYREGHRDHAEMVRHAGLKGVEQAIVEHLAAKAEEAPWN